ncbi:MAG: polysaccharide biosynthesis C-terminal domain-containing protein [Porphyromonas sp.]|nr:polysaccharide biosynthesis C-terminal domain-containing protein [Porphyromonas sp.]
MDSVVFRQSAKGTVVTLIGAMIGFITTFFLVTLYLTPEELGLTRVLVEVATLIGGLALLASQSSIVRYYPHFKTEDGADKGFLKWVLMIPALGFILFTVLYFLLREPLVRYFSASDASGLFDSYFYLVVPLMAFIMYLTTFEVYASVKQRVAMPKLIREVVLRLLLLGSYLTYGLTHLSFRSFVWLFVLSYGLCVLLDLLYVTKINPTGLRARIAPVSREIKQDFTKYTLFTVLSALGGTIVTRLDLFMVSSQMGFMYGGIYTIAFFIIAIIEMPARSLMSMSSPYVSAALYEEDREHVAQIYRRVSHHQLLAAMILFLLIWTNIDTLFAIIPNSEVYVQGKWVVFVLGLARMVDLTFNFGNTILRFSKYYPWTLAYTVIVTLLTILLNYYLIGVCGMEGAALSTLISFLISNSFQQYILTRKLGVTPIDKELGQIFCILGLLLLVEWGMPKSGLYALDSLWRTAVMVLVGWLLLRRLEVYKELQREVKAYISSLR